MAAATSGPSVSPSPNSPSLVPCSDAVPRVLNLSTAISASAGSRKAALRSTWLSIIPPCVGSGCRQISVAAGGRPAGRASSPIRLTPSAVRSVMGCRPAGSTVPALISLMSSASPAGSAAGRGPARPALPARSVPVPALVGAGAVGGPDHHVRYAGPDLLVAARTAVRLSRGGAGHLAHRPVAVRPRLGPLRAEPD